LAVELHGADRHLFHAFASRRFRAEGVFPLYLRIAGLTNKGRSLILGEEKMDLSSYSRQELMKLRKQVEQELDSRRRVDHRSARQEMKDIAEKYGLSLADLLSGSNTQPARGGKNALVYRHPSDSAKGWSGRGRKPNWIKQWEDSGRSLDELRRH
jgi:DNA-binding protein H-NS